MLRGLVALLLVACQPARGSSTPESAVPPVERALIERGLRECRDLQTTCEALSAGHFLEAKEAIGEAINRISDIPEMNGECLDVAFGLNDSTWFKAGVRKEAAHAAKVD